MKKNIISVASAVLATLLLSVSCSKQESIQSAGGARTFTASIEQGLTKTYLSNSSSTEILWNEKDLICINGYSLFYAIPTDNGTTAEFRSVGDVKLTAPYHAYYPSSIFDPDKGPVLPQTQKYEAGRLNTPMYALGTSENLEFKNICGILHLSLKTKSGEATIDSIKVHIEGENHMPYLWGPFSVDDGYNAVIDKDKAPQPYMGMPEEENPTIGFLDCGDGVVINDSEPTSFFIYLPPVSNGNYELTLGIFNTERKNVESHVNGDFSIERNKLYHLDLEVEFPQEEVRPCALPQNALSEHVFTVGEGLADKVYFSKANLVATYSDSGYSFGFAEEQNCFIGNNLGNSKLIGNNDLSENDQIDLFSWSTSSNQYGINNFAYESEAEGDFYDWGKAVLPADTWRTLSKDEWIYLFNAREVNGETGENYSYKVVKNFMVDNEYFSGIFIFPDDFESQNSFISTTSFNTWEKINNAGIVFLPLAGYVMENSSRCFYDQIEAYWSATSRSNGTQIYASAVLYENFVNLKYEANDIRNRASVRLVANARTIVSPAEEEAEQAEGK